MALYFAMLIGIPALMIIVGMYRMLAWARVVKTWHKSVGVVVGYYMRTGRWGDSERINFEMLASIESQHLKTRQHYNDPQHFFSAIIKYQYGYDMYEIIQEVRTDETLPYAPNEEMLVYINPKDPSSVKLGDNMSQLWLPFTLFAIGVVLSAGILIWGMQHGWEVE